MNNSFSSQAWEDYLYWQENDKATLRKINRIIRDIDRNGLNCSSKLEKMKYAPGCYSCRIDKTNRLVFSIENEEVLIHQCRTHYEWEK